MDDDARWTAVLGRDARADGAFLYGVRSTGVVCRPTCPSRRPGRANVEFLDTLEAARERGYRPCLRCRPERSTSDLRHLAEVRAACDLFHLDPSLSVSTVARRVGLRPRQFQRAFSWWLGVPALEYRAACRLGQFQARASSSIDATVAALDAGYRSPAGLYEHSGALGMTPGQYRAGGGGREIRFAAADTGDATLGAVLVAATEAGVCAVRFARSRREAVNDLAREFHAATRIEDPVRLGPWLAMVRDYLDGRSRLLALPLDVQGTLFQVRVWGALLEIPPGESRTYAEIADRIGRPGASRAVAQACASNPVALAVPCHRVVGRGGVSGYRWGVERKQRLLAQEARVAIDVPPSPAGQPSPSRSSKVTAPSVSARRRRASTSVSSEAPARAALATR